MAASLRFPVDKAVRAKYAEAPGSLTVRELPLSAAGTGGADEESLTLTFQPLNAVEVQLRPVFAGALWFLADGAPTFSIAADGSVTVDAKGTLVVRRHNVAELKASERLPALNVNPTTGWYASVRLTPAFLAQMLDLCRRKKLKVRVKEGEPEFSYKAPDWRVRLVGYFLSGYLSAPYDAKDLDLQMPVVDFAGGGAATVSIRMGLERAAMASPPKQPTEAEVEFVPPRLFLSHSIERKKIDLGTVDEVAKSILANRLTTKVWLDEFRDKLLRLGFQIAAETTPRNSPTLDWAIREFQIYASGARVAVERPGTLGGIFDLKGTTNNWRLQGGITGRANRSTRRAILTWMGENLRCPASTLAYESDKRGNTIGDPKAANFWVRNKPEAWSGVGSFLRRHRVCFADFTGLFAQPVDNVTAGDIVVIGYRTELATTKSTGPVGLFPGKREITPEEVLGLSTAQVLADPALAMRFKVFRAVSEQESQGFLDVHNAYDDAFLSLAPFHWSGVNIAENQHLTELGGFLHQLSQDPAGAAKLAAYGLGVKGVSGTKTPMKSAVICLTDDNGALVPIKTRADADYLASWHVYARFLALARRGAEYPKAAWVMAMHRLEKIAASRWDASRTFADVISSELLWAGMLRMHVYRPGWVINDGQAASRLQAMESAGKGKLDPQLAMFDALVLALEKELDAARAAVRAKVEAKAKEDGITDVKQIEKLVLAAQNKDKTVGSLKSLVGTLKDIKAPHWIENGVAKPNSGYTLDPKLRMLESSSGAVNPLPP